MQSSRRSGKTRKSPERGYQLMSRPDRSAVLPAAVAAWWSYVVLDFVTHAVVLASWWRSTQTYWLPPPELFRRIPIGYASFALYSAALTWLLARLYGERPGVRIGLRFGATAGLAFGLMSALGAYSLFRLSKSFLLVVPASTTVESVAAGAAAGWVLGASRPWRRVALVFGIGLLLFVGGVVAQNLFFPTPLDHVIPIGK